MFKKIVAVLLICCGFEASTFAVTARSSATRTVARTTSTPETSEVSENTNTRSATTTATNTTTSSSEPTVRARVAKTQNVIGTGTKVVATNKSVLTNQECQEKYFGCMDSLCMLDNVNGGRCACSDKNETFDSILAEIENLDQKTYEMMTVGVDSLEKGYDISVVYDTKEQNAKKVDLSLWDVELEPIVSSLPLANLKGDDLKIGAHQVCAKAIPECDSEMEYLYLLYNQQINSDCNAYENSLKKMRNESAEKLEAARLGLLDASYTALSNANKYDLGQCVTEFKNCMKTTGGCGDDFSGCATVSAFNATNTHSDVSDFGVTIKRESADIQISASTYDALLAKKPLCEDITRNCQNVADQVWDTFLREAAPEIKYAELIAEDESRQNCIGNISDCFRQACRENMDPDDPAGSYDMCLTRPGSMLSVCKIPLNACGISTDSIDKAESSPIWQFVLARLAAMRVNACTTEFKECLQSEDMCGSDYTKCVGLDTDTIIRMCPYDKLVGCQKVYGETNIRGDDVYDELYNVAQGIFLNIDNEMLKYCEAALDEAVISACGDTETCNAYIDNTVIGTRSLEYKICDYLITIEDNKIHYGNCRTNVSQITDEELGRVVGSTANALGPVTPLSGVIEGTLYWDSIEIDDDGNISSVEDYFDNIEMDASENEMAVVGRELGELQANLDTVYNLIESDPTIQFCMTGREVDGIKPYSGTSKPRFPELTKSTRLKIATQFVNEARQNYYQKYDELLEQQSQDYTTITERLAENRGENGKDARREAARQACIDLAQMSGLAKSQTPKSLVGTIIVGVIVIAAVVVLTIFTAGAGTIAVGAGVAAGTAATSAGTGAGVAAGTAAAISSAASTAAGSVVAGSTVLGATAAGTSAGIAAGTSAAIAAGSGASLIGAAGMGMSAVSVAAATASASAAAASLATSATIATIAGSVGAAILAAGVTGVAASDWSNNSAVDFNNLDLSGEYTVENWNYKETITTDFDWENLVCTKCVRTQNCDSIKTPIFGSYKCKKWADPEPAECTDIQF